MTRENGRAGIAMAMEPPNEVWRRIMAIEAAIDRAGVDHDRIIDAIRAEMAMDRRTVVEQAERIEDLRTDLLRSQEVVLEVRDELRRHSEAAAQARLSNKGRRAMYVAIFTSGVAAIPTIIEALTSAGSAVTP